MAREHAVESPCTSYQWIFKGTVSGEGLGFCLLKRVDLCLNKGRGRIEISDDSPLKQGWQTVLDSKYLVIISWPV
jgi:hypothetical protein